MPPASVTLTVQWVPPCLPPSRLRRVTCSMSMTPDTTEPLRMLLAGCQHLLWRLVPSASLSTSWKRRACGLHQAWLSHSYSCHRPSQQSPFLGETGSAWQAVCQPHITQASAKLMSPSGGRPGPGLLSPGPGLSPSPLSQLRLQPLGGDPAGCLSGLPGARDLSV